MQLPKYHETFIPILNVLSDGQALHYNDLQQKVRDQFYSHLPPELLEQKTKSGDVLILNRIGWGKVYLKKIGAVAQPARAMVKITDKGRDILSGGSYTLEDLQNDSEYKLYTEKRLQRNSIVEAIGNENATPEDMIDYGVTSIEDQVKSELLDKLQLSDPYYFERVVLKLLHKIGYGDFIETKKSGDGGIDGIINQDQFGLDKIYVQAKRYCNNKVREIDIRNFIGAMSGDTSKGVFITTSDFDDNAKSKAKLAHHKIILINGKELADLMYKYNVGVQIKNEYEIKQIDADFFEHAM